MKQPGTSPIGWTTLVRVVVTGAALLVVPSLTAAPAAASDGACHGEVTGRTNVSIAIDPKLGTCYNAEPITCSPGSAVTLFSRADLRKIHLDQRNISLFVATDGRNARTGTYYRDCLLPLRDGCTRSITTFMGGGAGMHHTTVTATGVDEAGTEVRDTASEEVGITDALPAIHVEDTADPALIVEPGGAILHTVEVTNDSGLSDPVTLISLVHSVYGDLTDDDNPDISNSTCELVTIPPAVTYVCTLEAEVEGMIGDSVTDTVMAVVVDDDGNEAQAAADATVTIVSEPPDTGVGFPAPWAVASLALAGSVVLAAGVTIAGRPGAPGQ